MNSRDVIRAIERDAIGRQVEVSDGELYRADAQG